MRIEKIKIHQIGIFDDLEIEFAAKTNQTNAEVHVFTGPNGSGKSTILYSIASLFGFQAGMFNRCRTSESYCEGKADGKPLITSRSNIKILDELSPLDMNAGKDKLYMHKTMKTPFDLDKVYPFKTRQYNPTDKIKNDKFDFAVFTYAGNRDINSIKLEGIIEDKDNPFADSLSFTKSANSQKIIQWIANTITKIALAKNKNDFERAEQLQAYLDKISNFIGEVSSFQIGFELEDTPLNVVLRMDGKIIEFDVLPDGLKSIISWIADLLMRMDRINWVDNTNIFERNFILLLDEIDIHLHPAWQRKILPAVQKLFTNAQIFVSTHSPFVVASISDAWIYKLKLENGKSVLEEVIEAKQGYSYSYILEEIFGISEEFDVETEKKFARFYILRDEINGNNFDNENEFRTLATDLASKSSETRDIIGRELRQLTKQTGKDFKI